MTNDLYHPVQGPSVIVASGQLKLAAPSVRSESALVRCARSKLGRKFLGLYLALSKRIWNLLPASVRLSGGAYGSHLHAMTLLQADRRQYVATFFMRNRPELELIQRLAGLQVHGSRLNIAVLACSKGAEVYSIAWAIRSVRPDLTLKIQAVDISQDIVHFAEKGIYSTAPDALGASDREAVAKNGDVDWNTHRDQGASMFERMTKDEVEAMFEVGAVEVRVRTRFKEGITWSHGDAGDPDLIAALGPQDIVVANRFLCHMQPAHAEKMLRNLAKAVKPGGYLFVSGIDLDVRMTVARALGWKPVTDMLRAIHEGDQSLRDGWPLEYWGLEPFRDDAPDWQLRYSSVFQIGEGENTVSALVLQGSRGIKR